MMGHRGQCHQDEYDAFSPHWKRVTNWCAGARAAIKRRFNKRQRRIYKVRVTVREGKMNFVMPEILEDDCLDAAEASRILDIDLDIVRAHRLRMWLVRSAVITKEDDGGYSAEVPSLPGCITQADTLPELAGNILEAIAGYIAAQKGVTDKDFWLHKNPKAIAAVLEGLEDARAGNFVEGPDLEADAALAYADGLTTCPPECPSQPVGG